MKLRDWFSKYHNRPLKIAAAFLIAVWFVFAYRSYEDITQKQNLAATQIADLLSVSVGSRDRTMTESLLETLVEQSGASSAAICEGSKQFLAANQDFLGCSSEKLFLKTIVERKISGSNSLRLKVTYDWLMNFTPSLTLLAFCLVLVVAGFYFIQMAQRQIEKGVLSPLMSKLFTNDKLEIDELNELRDNVRKVQMIEAQKAVALAIEENNQQVAHDIRSPIAAINELLKLVPVSNPKVRSALEKAMDRANSVANDLLTQEVDQKKGVALSSYDFAATIQDIATEKRPLFAEGSIEINLNANRFVAQTRLPQVSLARILSNVIDNAMTACAKQKQISVHAESRDGYFEISVTDTGMGISKDMLKFIGEKGFSLVKPSGAKGTGRGVYQAKQTLSEIGGSIEFNSTLGAGTTVVIRVPVQIVAADSPPPDFILVDNDDFSRMAWDVKAAAHGRTIKTFSTVDELFAASDSIQKHTPIFLDSHLGNGERGQAAAPKLRHLGFKRIYVTTNYADLHGAKLPDVDAVIEKNCDRAIETLNYDSAIS